MSGRLLSESNVRSGVMTDDDWPETPLARVMQALNLKRNDVVRAARKIARELGIRPISRRQLGRFLSGENKPTEERSFS